MTENESKILKLIDQLEDLDDTVCDCETYLCSEDPYEDFKDMIVLSESIDDYQVFRHFAVDISYVDDIIEYYGDESDKEERDELAEKRDKELAEIKQKMSLIYDDLESSDTEFGSQLRDINSKARKEAKNMENKIWDKYYDDVYSIEERIAEWQSYNGVDYMHTCDHEETVQEWLNVKTGECVIIGLSNGKPKVLNKDNKDDAKFIEDNNYGGYHYRDLNVHPDLYAVGYDGIDNTEWTYWDSDTEATKFIEKREEQGGWVKFISDLVKGVHSDYDIAIRQYGFYAYMHLVDKDEDYVKDYHTAMRIVRRNKYIISDRQLWNDMFDNLRYLKKDIHNAHYVCPANLKTAHDNLYKERRNTETRIEKKRYAERMAKYKDVVLSNKYVDIYVCPTVDAMKREGLMMNHCVYNNQYYKESKRCLILLVRGKKGEPISTVELSTLDWRIKQNRGKKNAVPKYKATTEKLIVKNIEAYKHPEKFVKPTIIPMYPKTNHQPLKQAA